MDNLQPIAVLAATVLFPLRYFEFMATILFLALLHSH